jgi:hypothetical protein
MELPIGFTLKAAGNLTLKATELSNFAEGTKVYLLDKVLNTQTELTAGAEYNFSISESTSNNESRFTLLFGAPGANTAVNDVPKSQLQVYVNANKQLVINAAAGSKYAVYNAMGQLIDNGMLNTSFVIRNSKLNTGVYVVKVNNETRRVVIK